MGIPTEIRPSPTATAAKARAHILVTDDRSEMTVAIKAALAEHYECDFATDVSQAREMIADGPTYDLVICDTDDPAGSAMGLAEEIVKGALDTAVIMVTEEDDPTQAREAFEFGAYGYIVKPPWPGLLLMTTMNALRRRELEISHREHTQNLKDRGQTIIDMVPIPIYAKDLTGHYVVANAKADELAGLERGALVGMTDEDFLSPEEQVVSGASDSQVLEDRTSHEREDTVVIHEEAKTFKSVRFPLLDEDGEISAVGGVSVDITAERETTRLHEELAATQKRAIVDLELSRRETIRGLAKAIALHDSSTGQHVDSMAGIAALLGAQLGLDPDRVELLRAAAPMHDVGKIGTPPEILCKQGSLDAAERRTMQLHATIGHEIFADFQSDLSKMAATIAFTHHERYDGSGYPQGTAGEAIPIEGRITAVADVFDALLRDRSYRPAMSVKDAVEVIVDGKGTHFDPRVVDALIDNLQDALATRDRLTYA